LEVARAWGNLGSRCFGREIWPWGSGLPQNPPTAAAGLAETSRRLSGGVVARRNRLRGDSGQETGALREGLERGKMIQEEEAMPEQFWHVYNYLARQWYETEYGKVPYGDRYYGVAMDYLSMRAATEMTRMVWGESDQSTAA